MGRTSRRNGAVKLAPSVAVLATLLDQRGQLGDPILLEWGLAPSLSAVTSHPFVWHG